MPESLLFLLGMQVKDLLPFTVSLCALALTIWQGFLQRRHNRQSMLPLLTIRSLISASEREAWVVMRNEGVGPAIIRDIRVYIDGSRYVAADSGEWISKLMSMNFPHGKTAAGWWDASQNGLNLGVGRKHVLIRLTFHPEFENDHSAKVMTEFNRIRFEVEYESVYREKFSVNSYT